MSRADLGSSAARTPRQEATPSPSNISNGSTMAPARKPASRRSPAKPSAKANPSAAARSRPRARAQRSSLGALGLPALEQRHRDLIGLGLVALGVFLAFALYLGWEGGVAGQAATSGLAYAVGQVAYAVPIAIVATGALFVLRPVLPTMRPFRAGGLCLFGALTLMLAAGTFGLGPDGARHGYWDAPFFEPRGGIAGEALLWAVASAVSTIGAHILALFLFVAGVLLLTGATVAGVLRTTGSGLADTTRAISRVVPVPARRVKRPAERQGPGEPEPGYEPVADEERFAVPEPGEGEMIVRATHVEATAPAPRPRPPAEGSVVGRRGFWSGATRFPDIYGEPLPEPGEKDADPREEAEAELDAAPEAPGYDEPPAAPVDSLDPDEPDSDATAAMRRPVGPGDLTPQGRLRGSVTDDPEFRWRLPSVNLLRRSSTEQLRPDTAGQAKTAARLVEVLGHFGVEAKIVGTVAGPHITRFELRLVPGIKMSKVAQLKDDLAYALAATDIRILAPIPGKTAVGVEVPNARRRIVQLGDVNQDAPAGWSPLTIWLGKDVAGKAIGADLTKMPHLLVAGTTGAGKSACINAMLSSVLLRATPHELRLVLIDPKQVELNHYESIPHLLTPVITSPRMAANALQNLVREMEQRYSVMSLAKTRSLIELNRSKAKRGEAPLPYILCVIDELADLMMVAPADVEDSIIRL
ncbi:MAG: FtsK/SpoIIIE domain-containing protein, partial [Actinomycetota bacterium]|nr:FtsK/SpoIIIE domain-containing protein [Actinomycetota bacterium]